MAVCSALAARTYRRCQCGTRHGSATHASIKVRNGLLFGVDFLPCEDRRWQPASSAVLQDGRTPIDLKSLGSHGIEVSVDIIARNRPQVVEPDRQSRDRADMTSAGSTVLISHRTRPPLQLLVSVVMSVCLSLMWAFTAIHIFNPWTRLIPTSLVGIATYCCALILFWPLVMNILEEVSALRRTLDNLKEACETTDRQRPLRI
jgi:hypothetical protein